MMDAVVKQGRLLGSMFAAGVVVVLLWWLSSPPPPTGPALGSIIAASVARLAPPVGSPDGRPPGPPTAPVACIADPDHVTLRSLEDGLPGVCTGTSCVLPARDTVVSAPANDAEQLPVAAIIRAGDAPAACLADHCRSLGRKLAAAVAAEAKQPEPVLQATLDLSTAVVGATLWSIARDRPIAPPRPYYHPNENVGRVRAAGDLVLVHWEGSCVDALCMVSHMLDARGRDLDMVDVEGGMLRLGDLAFVAFSIWSGIGVYDLHTGKRIAYRDEPLGIQSYVAAARLAPSRIGERFALLRRIDNGFVLEVVLLQGNQLHDESQHYFAECRELEGEN